MGEHRHLLAGQWQIETRRGSAADLHSLSADSLSGDPASGPIARCVRVMCPSATTIVLGSAQPDIGVDRVEADRRGLAVARRRSGGGAVVVGPGESLWIDLLIPTQDPLWSADVSVAAWWVGDLWAAALSDVGVTGLDVWKGPMTRNRWSARICFAGLGPGEVSAAGRKVFGVSQRRTRVGVLYQTATLLRWRPEDLLAVLGQPDDPPQALRELAEMAQGIGSDLEVPLRDAVLGRLMP